MTVIHLPIETGEIELAEGEQNVFWKQIIPLNKEIVYGGNKIKFGKDLLDRLKANYDAKVLHQTAFQLADDDNQHERKGAPLTENFDPRRYRGEVQQLVVNDQGLVGKFKLTTEGAKMIADNPKLGVSASIKPDYVGEDGVKHDFVLRHVLGTLAPVIKHMSPWQREAISLSEPNEEVYDLTAPADTQTPDTSADEKPKLEVDKAEYEKMQKRLADVDGADELLNSVIAEVDAEDKLVSLSDTQSNKVAEDPRITELQNRAAASEWKAMRAEYVKSGVPIKLLNLCDEVMSVYEAPTINLSDGKSVDPRKTIEALLDESKGLIDLSDESGHGMSVDEREAENKATDEYINGFMGKFNMDLF